MGAESFASRRSVAQTDFGDIAYIDVGAGPVALFVHGVFLNAYVWRNVISDLKQERRCIAVDLLGHGFTHMAAGQEPSLSAQADMLAAFCDSIGMEDQIDLVGNDSGGAIAQIFAVHHTDRLRTLTLTNCDVHDNLPPAAFKPVVDLAIEGELAPVLPQVINNLKLARSDTGFGTSYESPEYITEELVRAYFEPAFSTPEAARDVERFIDSISGRELVDIEPLLKKLEIPTLIVWGTDDVFFELSWAYWLRDTIPGAAEVVEIDGGRLFFPDERAGELIPHLKRHLT